MFLSPSAVFINVINPRSQVSRKNEYRKTIVKKGASIGANATTVCGHDIGKYAFIGAGTVVTKDVPDFALVLGNPARVAGWVCKCGSGLQFTDESKTIVHDNVARTSAEATAAVCGECGGEYMKEDDNVQIFKVLDR